MIEAWRRYCNAVRSHLSLVCLMPSEFGLQHHAQHLQPDRGVSQD